MAVGADCGAGVSCGEGGKEVRMVTTLVVVSELDKAANTMLPFSEY